MSVGGMLFSGLRPFQDAPAVVSDEAVPELEN
jgi:hypothetical protein